MRSARDGVFGAKLIQPVRIKWKRYFELKKRPAKIKAEGMPSTLPPPYNLNLLLLCFFRAGFFLRSHDMCLLEKKLKSKSDLFNSFSIYLSQGL